MNGRNLEMKRNLRSFLGSLPFNREFQATVPASIARIVPQCNVVCLVYSPQSRLWYTFATLAGANSSWKPFLGQDVIMFLDAHVLPVPGRS